MADRRRVGVVLFPGFEVLDVFGPLEVFGGMPDHFDVVTVAERAGAVASAQRTSAVADTSFADCPACALLLVPGGIGTRREVENPALLDWLRTRTAAAELVMSVCTGAGLLARAGLLDGRRATTNKRNFAWPVSQGPQVRWVAVARWVEDGKFVTSSGVSAGIDMSLHVVARLVGRDVAQAAAQRMEYAWHQDADDDPFARLYGLA
jgi:transcriptional regulator GlxA family with amidase domain